MNYLESIAYLESLSPTLEKPTVERIKRFLDSHGRPQNSFKSFHVGGTNGKGSTAAVLDSVLRAAGHHVGRFTGPHLLRWNERFHVDGKPISDEQFASYATQLRKLSENFALESPEIGALTWFEFITALAFFYFRDEKIQTAVLEVGLGGRFDATNVLGENLLCSIITNISLDHTHILGATESLIAFEKAGIIMPGKPLVTAAQGAALDIIKTRAAELLAPVICFSSEGEIAEIETIENGALSRKTADQLRASVQTALQQAKFEEVRGALIGEHQRLNAKLAFTAIFLAETGALSTGPRLISSVTNTLNADDCLAPVLLSSWAEGVRKVYWPGRMQQVSERIILDGAHNPGGARALRAALDLHFAGKRSVFVLSCFDNKDAGGILQALFKPGDLVFLCEASTRRATFPKAKLLEIAHDLKAHPEIFDTIGGAYHAALQVAGPEDLVVATGSFATVRECMQEFGWQSVEDGRGKSGKIDSAETVR